MNSISPETLSRYLQGSATAADEAEVRRWTSVTPEAGQLLVDLEAAWQLAERVPEEHDSAAGWARVQARLTEPAAAGERPRPTVRSIRSRPAARERRTSTLLRAAAVLALFAGGTIAWSLRESLLPVPARTYATAAGERAALRLSDGSRVVLGPGSEFETPVRFRRGERTVRLSGSAGFTVQPDAERPFLVHAGGAVTRVLGTTFVVRAYPDEELVEVGVVEGRVNVRAETAPEGAAMLLGAGEAGQVDARGRARRISGADAEALLGWSEGRLTFTDAPLPHVIRDLERWYGVDFQLADPSLARRHLTATFADDPLEAVLDVLDLTLGVRHQREGKTIILMPNDPAP